MNLIEKIFKIDKTKFKRKCDYEIAILKKIIQLLILIQPFILLLYSIGLVIFFNDYSLFLSNDKMSNWDIFLFLANMLSISILFFYITLFTVFSSYTIKKKCDLKNHNKVLMFFELIFFLFVFIFGLYLIFLGNIIYWSIGFGLTCSSLCFILYSLDSWFNGIKRVILFTYLKAKRKHCKLIKD